MSKNPTVIEGRNLVKTYDGKNVVDGIHFEIRQGECFGILGPNGAGKTSTLKMMYGLSEVSSGKLFVLGLNVQTNIEQIKARIGVVSQDDGLDTDFSVIDNLVMFARYFGIPRGVALTRGRELLRFMHLEDYEDRSVETLSGGMKRRLTVARSLMSQPDVLVLDEPTTGLDPQARFWIWESLSEMKRQGKTLVLTTHYMEEAENICDRLIILDKGKILCEGKPADLIKFYIGLDVIEFQVDLRDLNYHMQKIKGAFEYQILNRRVRMFIPEGKDSKEALKLVTSDDITIRRATLNDVFLKLAGYELREGA
jgi:lipooligosaccharide transport system ATP-binding protein